MPTIVKRGKALFALLLSVCLLSIPAHAARVEYPLVGNLRPAAGTVEMWVRLDTEPGLSTSLPLLLINQPNRQLPQINFKYTAYWKPEELHLYLRMDGYLDRRPTEGGMNMSMENTWTQVKTANYPRHERLHKGDWHHIAFTWQGAFSPQSMVYLDGKIVAPQMQHVVEPWPDLEKGVLSLMETHVTWDELKISERVLTPEQIAASFARGALVNDESTLLLEHFDTMQEGKTLAAQIAGYKGDSGGMIHGGNAAIVEGKFGKALKLMN